MRSVVTGLMMLAGAVVREQGQGLNDYAWRREVQGVASEATQTTGEVGDRGADATVTVVAGPAMSVEPSASSDNGEHPADAMSVAGATGDWNVACVRKRG